VLVAGASIDATASGSDCLPTSLCVSLAGIECLSGDRCTTASKRCGRVESLRVYMLWC
jgi:hypothetical protein